MLPIDFNSDSVGTMNSKRTKKEARGRRRLWLVGVFAAALVGAGVLAVVGAYALWTPDAADQPGWSDAADYRADPGEEWTAVQPVEPPPDPVEPPPDPVEPEDPEFEAVGPIAIEGESDILVEGVHVSNANGPCILIRDSDRVVIRNTRIGPCGGDAIEVRDSSQVMIANATIERAATGVNAERAQDLTITASTFGDVTKGVYALSSEQIIVEGNQFIDAGRNFVQFDKVNGPGSRIAENIGRNNLGSSDAEDFINVYQSSGTSESPIEIIGNVLRDGGPSASGSGIMVGDNGGSFIVVEDNLLINPGQAGIGVASGHDITVARNVVYSDPVAWSNVGIYVWNQYSAECLGITVSENRVQWLHPSTGSSGAWDGGNCGTISGWDTNTWDANLDIDPMWSELAGGL